MSVAARGDWPWWPASHRTHMAFTYSSGTGTHYLDGAVNTVSSASGTLTIDPSAVAPIGTAVIGRNPWGASNFLDFYFKDFRVYDSALR